MIFHPTRFWNYIAAGYARRPVKDNDAYQRKLEMTARNLTDQDRVLEFGYGTGTTTLIHAARVQHIDAIDFASKMIAIAQEKADQQKVTNVRFEISAFEAWPLPSAEERYDAVLGMSILHLVADLDSTLARVAEALKPGGLFFSSTMCGGEMWRLARLALASLGALGILPKISLLTPDILTERIESQGFEIEHVWRLAGDAAVFVITRKS